MKRILIIPPESWYQVNNAEYLVRYLSDEFDIEIGEVPYPPYDQIVARFPETTPFQRNPDDYDLLFPLLPTHWQVPRSYEPKIATVFYQIGEGYYKDAAVLGVCNPLAETNYNRPYHKLRWGVDTNFFQPLHFKRSDNLLRVGMVGHLGNPRRNTINVVRSLRGLEGIKLMLFWGNKPSKQDLQLVDDEKMEYSRYGDKGYSGLPNIYNQLDVLIRVDQNMGYSFPTLEAAACGVPVIATDQGIDSQITNAGGGILIRADVVDSNGDGRLWYVDNQEKTAERVRNAVVLMRDNPTERLAMGYKGRREIEKNWQWPRFIPAWREFFREGLQNAHSTT